VYRTSKNKMVKRTGVSVVVALGALATGVGIAGASTHTVAKASGAATSSVTTSLSHPGDRQARGSGMLGGPGMMRGLGGLVTAVTSSSITVQDLKGASATYAIDSATTVLKDRQSATAADLAVGEHVRIIASSSSATTAAGVDIELARVAGQVVSVSGSSITVSDRDGFYRTVAVSGSTTYSKSGVSAALSDVTTGSFIMAEGTVDSNHTTLDASAVGIGLPSTTGAPQGIASQGMAGGFGGMNGRMN
jgi:hypothetical protein